MTYVVQLTSGNGKYRAGVFMADPSVTGGASYTPSLRLARTFHSREAAQSECCENEAPRAVDELMQRPR